MKIHWDIAGKELAKPDFATLRTGLAAAQATTPTAAVSDRAQERIDLTEALTLLFGDRGPGGKGAAALHGSFHPVPDQEQIAHRRKR